MGELRVATAIFNAPLGAVDRNIERIGDFCLDAVKHGANLICFPEMAITGYSTSKDIIPFSMSLNEHRLLNIKRISENLDITILVGMAEKDDSGRIFASHLVFVPGKPLCVYRKTHIAPPERTIFSEGSDIPIFETIGFRFGIQLCYDAHFPFLSTRMAEKGADIIFIPHASPRGTPEEKYDSWMRHIPARAYDNSLYVVASNQTGYNGASLTFPGLAFVTDPSGHVISKDITGNEGLLFTDLSQSALDHVRNHRMRYFLPNMRKDIG
jgi:N-carbamoylputrescine amidase